MNGQWDFTDYSRALTPNRDPYVEVEASKVMTGDLLLVLKQHGTWGICHRDGHAAAVWAMVTTADRPKRTRTCYLNVRTDEGEAFEVRATSTWPVLIRDPNAGPRFPEGTPEYEAYRTELTVELGKFARREPPYDTGL